MSLDDLYACGAYERLYVKVSPKVTMAAGVAQAELVAFRDYDAATGTFKDAVRECAFVTDETRVLEDGWWYAVEGTVSIPDGLTVKGSVHLVLCDGASLTANCTNMLPGVSVSHGNTLVIYGQTASRGSATRSTARPHCRSAAVSARPPYQRPGRRTGRNPATRRGRSCFGAVEKPSDAAGFFTIGVSATKGE